MGSVIECNDLEEFHALLSKHSVVVVDCYAPWCGPCKVAKPVIERFAKAYPSICVVAVNVDEAHDIATELQVESLPSFYVIKSGQVVMRRHGFNAKLETDFVNDLVKAAQ